MGKHIKHKKEEKKPNFRWVRAPGISEPLPLVYFSASYRPHLTVTFGPFSYSESPEKVRPLSNNSTKNACKDDPIIVSGCATSSGTSPVAYYWKVTHPGL